MSTVDFDRLREALARHLADEEAASRGALPYAETSWACVRSRWLPKADRFMPLITTYVEKQSRKYAADAIRWAANDVDMHYGVRMDLQARANWVRAGHQFE